MSSSLRHSIFRRFLRDIRGATIIEFAIVAPVFFLIMLGIIEYGASLQAAVRTPIELPVLPENHIRA